MIRTVETRTERAYKEAEETIKIRQLNLSAICSGGILGEISWDIHAAIGEETPVTRALTMTGLGNPEGKTTAMIYDDALHEGREIQQRLYREHAPGKTRHEKLLGLSLAILACENPPLVEEIIRDLGGLSEEESNEPSLARAVIATLKNEKLRWQWNLRVILPHLGDKTLKACR